MPSAHGAGGDLTTCSLDGAWVSAGVRGKPGLQLLQRQSLDAGGGGVAQGPAAAVELAEGDNGFAFRHPLLGRTGSVSRLTKGSSPGC